MDGKKTWEDVLLMSPYSMMPSGDPLSDLEVLARLLERAGILVGADPGRGPDCQSIQQGINRLGNMVRDTEGRIRTLQRQLNYTEHKARQAASDKSLMEEQRNQLQAKYEKALKTASDQAQTIGEMQDTIRRMSRRQRKKR